MPTTEDVLETLRAKYADHPVDSFDQFAAHVKLEALKAKLLVDVLPIPEGSVTIVRRQMTEEEAIAVLDSINADDDPERAHGEGDWVLMSCAPTGVYDAYARLEDRAPWWAGA